VGAECYFSPGLKRPEHKTDYARSLMAKIKNAWSFTSTASPYLHFVVLKRRGNFTLNISWSPWHGGAHPLQLDPVDVMLKVKSSVEKTTNEYAQVYCKYSNNPEFKMRFKCKIGLLTTRAV
jgi:hypothetical protein